MPLLVVYIPFNIIVSGTSKEKGDKENVANQKHVSARVIVTHSFVATVQHMYMHMLIVTIGLQTTPHCDTAAAQKQLL